MRLYLPIFVLAVLAAGFAAFSVTFGAIAGPTMVPSPKLLLSADKASTRAEDARTSAYNRTLSSPVPTCLPSAWSSSAVVVDSSKSMSSAAAEWVIAPTAIRSGLACRCRGRWRR